MRLLFFLLFFCALIRSEFNWYNHGKDEKNARYVSGGSIKKGAINLKEPKCIYKVGSYTTATPMIYNNYIIFPSWDGSLTALHRSNCNILWKKNITSDYYNNTLSKIVVSRATPVVWQDKDKYFILPIYGPGDILLIKMFSGNLVWRKNIDSHPHAVITQSGTVVGDIYYTGVSSLEELAAANPSYPCCNFTGSIHAINLTSQAYYWPSPFKTIPIQVSGVGKWSGGAVWGSSPSVDLNLNLIFFSTGNTYEHPEDYEDCLMTNNNTNIEENCNSPLYPDVYFNSVLALDLNTGELEWGKRVSGADAWNVACSSNGPNCPSVPGLNFDFGIAPALSDIDFCACSTPPPSPTPTSTLTPHSPSINSWRNHHNVKSSNNRNGNNDNDNSGNKMSGLCKQIGGQYILTNCEGKRTEKKSVIYAAQKSGIVYCFLASDGTLIWANQTAPGGTLGGINWGFSVDEERVYVPIINTLHLPWVLSNGTTTTCGGWAGLNRWTGQTIWSTSIPACYDPSGGGPGSNGRHETAWAAGPPTVVNDLIIVGSTDTVFLPNISSGVATSGQAGGSIFLLDKNTGSILDDYETKSSIYGGASVDERCFYIGHGYQQSFGLSFGENFYVFCAGHNEKEENKNPATKATDSEKNESKSKSHKFIDS